MNLSNFAAQLFVEVKEWVEDLIVKERALADDRLDEALDKVNAKVLEQEDRTDSTMELINELISSHKALDEKQDLCADAIKTLETRETEVLQKWADNLIDPVAKARQEFGDLAEKVVGIDTELKSQMDTFEIVMMEHLVQSEEKFITDFSNTLAAELLEEGEVLRD